MKKPQMILIVVGVILGLALLVVMIQTYSSMSDASKAAETFTNTTNEYVRIYKSANPFPDDDNEKILNDNLKQAITWKDDLLEIISEGKYKAESDHPTPGYFSNKRQEMIERLTSTAPKGPDGKSVAVEGLTFGFDKYKDGVQAIEDNVPRLMMQLSMIDNLVQLLYAAEIDKLNAVRREEFEDAASDDEESTTTSRRSSRRSSRSSRTNASTATNSGGPVTIEPFEQGAIPVERQRFEFVFDARQDALMKVLNAIGTMKPYALVSKLSFTKAGEDYYPPVDEKKGDKKSNRRSRNEEEIEKPTTGIINVRPPSRTSRLVSGNLRETPVTVTMTVDVFTFSDDEEEDVNSEDDTSESKESAESEEPAESDETNDNTESNEEF